MTPEEQQQVNAAFRFFEAQVANLTREGANIAMACEALAMQNKSLREENEKLKPKEPLKAVE